MTNSLNAFLKNTIIEAWTTPLKLCLVTGEITSKAQYMCPVYYTGA
jgi:hypothetical protein